jgi:dethiobiotin synthetase
LLDQKIQKSRRKAISIFSSLKEPSQRHQKNLYIAPFRQTSRTTTKVCVSLFNPISLKMLKNRYFITGIGTNVGKTIVSAILTEALKADYWKPIQSGTNEGLDSTTIKELISNTKTIIHPEAYLLKEPLSPHMAAKIDGVNIELEHIELPKTQNNLIIEGAGGLMVPINSKHYVIDIAKKIDCEIIVVISNYLGCINHSLLTIDYLIKHNFKIKAFIFNGDFNTEVKESISNYAPSIKNIDIPALTKINKETILSIANTVAL